MSELQLHENHRDVDIGGEESPSRPGSWPARAHGAVTVRSGATVVLATPSVAARRVRNRLLPLTVDIEEKMLRRRQDPRRFFKREGKASERPR